MPNERRAESFGYISSCQLHVFGRPSHGGWIIRSLHFSVVASSHFVGNEKQISNACFHFLHICYDYLLFISHSQSFSCSVLFVLKPEIKSVFSFCFWVFFVLAMECWESTEGQMFKRWPYSPLCIAALLLTLFLNVVEPPLSISWKCLCVVHWNTHLNIHGQLQAHSGTYTITGTFGLQNYTWNS